MLVMIIQKYGWCIGATRGGEAKGAEAPPLAL